ncbi:MAG: DUF6587 family protein [Pseudoxanthomonas sp.]
MDLSLALQYLIIAVAVLVSACVVMNKQFPGTSRRLRVNVALLLLRAGRAGWMKRLGRWIAPATTSDAGACGGCSSCGPEAPRQH